MNCWCQPWFLHPASRAKLLFSLLLADSRIERNKQALAVDFLQQGNQRGAFFG